MQHKKKTPSPATTPASAGLNPWTIALWITLFGGMLFFLPFCMDRYLAPRFFYLSAALALSFWLVRKDIQARESRTLDVFGFLLLGWYCFNLASVYWAHSWSEGVFYAQKPLLLFLGYLFLREALTHNASETRQTLRRIVTLTTWTTCGIITLQLIYAYFRSGLDNQTLYDFASGLFGNKSLAAEFLFFLVVLNVMLYREYARRNDLWVSLGWLGVLILLLQTRTVYMTLLICVPVYLTGRAVVDKPFRPVFLKKILPFGIGAFLVLAALIGYKGRGNSMMERLNPLTYLDSETANERRFVWYKTGQLNREHFWLGVGDGSWKFWFPSKNIEGGYRLEEQNVVFTRVHNDYLEIQAETGIIGLAYFLLLFAVAFVIAGLALRKSLRSPENEARHDILTAATGLLGYCLIQSLDFPRERIEFQLILGLLFAWILFAGSQILPGFSRKGLPLKPVLPLIAGAGLLFNLVIGWFRITGEYHNVQFINHQNNREHQAVVRETALSENPFYEYTDVSLPVCWHEGVAWYQMGKMDKAVEAFARAYRLNPWSFQVMNNYASALVKNNQFREAVPLYEQALTINPSFDDGKLNVAFVYFKLGEFSKAMDWVNRVDTIANPLSESDRDKNRQILKRQAEFRKTIEEKMK